MKHRKVFLFIIWLSLLLAACSSNDNSESADTGSEEANESTSEQASMKKNGLSKTPQSEGENATESIIESTKDKMMVYQANIQLETSDYDQFYQTLEKRMSNHEAYMVETNIHKTEQGNRQGHIRLRVPQGNFQALLKGFEEYSDEIISRNISGRDVTKEYVDLESRLKAQEKVESRLLNFLDQAEATADLIKISQDLERIQEEIEVIKGEMNYLQNQSDYSTITLSIKETKVVIPRIENQKLNTWEKTKQAFASSINHLASFFSWLTVFFLGYSPVLLSIVVISFVLWFIRRKVKQKNSHDD